MVPKTFGLNAFLSALSTTWKLFNPPSVTWVNWRETFDYFYCKIQAKSFGKVILGWIIHGEWNHNRESHATLDEIKLITLGQAITGETATRSLRTNWEAYRGLTPRTPEAIPKVPNPAVTGPGELTNTHTPSSRRPSQFCKVLQLSETFLITRLPLEQLWKLKRKFEIKMRSRMVVFLWLRSFTCTNDMGEKIYFRSTTSQPEAGIIATDKAKDRAHKRCCTVGNFDFHRNKPISIRFK